jgi:hypothetical protein
MVLPVSRIETVYGVDETENCFPSTDKIRTLDEVFLNFDVEASLALS